MNNTGLKLIERCIWIFDNYFSSRYSVTSIIIFQFQIYRYFNLPRNIISNLYNNFSTYDLTNSTTHNFHAYSSIIPRYKSDIQALNSTLLPLFLSHPRCSIHISSLEQPPRNNLILTHLFTLGRKKKKHFPWTHHEHSLVKFKRRSLGKILIFRVKTNVFPSKIWHRDGRAHYAHEKTRQNDFVRSGSRAST